MQSLEITTEGTLTSILLRISSKLAIKVESASDYLEETLAIFMISILQNCKSNNYRYKEFKIVSGSIQIVGTNSNVLPTRSMIAIRNLLRSRTYRREGSTNDYRIIFDDAKGKLFYCPYNSRDGTVKVYRVMTNKLIYKL